MGRRVCSLLSIVLFWIPLSGCGANDGPMVFESVDSRHLPTSMEGSPPEDAASPVSEELAGGAVPTAGVVRKVIYNASLDLNVKDLDATGDQLRERLSSVGGYIAEETQVGSPGKNRTHFWRLRLPTDRFDEFVASVKELGELVQFNRKSQDVTEEFYDVDANVRNKQAQERTLQKILQERAGDLDQVLKVEAQLARVRGEIERLQGRLRVLDGLSSMATLTLTFREVERFEPTTPIVDDFASQIARTWRDSLSNFLGMSKALILLAVSQIIWLPIWIAGFLLVRYAVRFSRPPG